MTSTAGEDRWRSLGTLLVQRRTALDPRYHNRGAFCEATGLKYRLVYDIEEARRTNFGTSTLAAIEAAYQLRPGAIATFLAGGSLTPDPASTPAARPEIPSPPSFLTPEEKLAANPAASRLFDRIAKVGAGRDPAALSGYELFAGEDDAEADVLADGWDAVREGALRGAFGWDDAVWFAGLAFHRNARAQERRRPGRDGIRGALIPV